ncbi:MAG: hypothetical protein ACHQF2_02755 [Flavobacteriales bacterium]
MRRLFKNRWFYVTVASLLLGLQLVARFVMGLGELPVYIQSDVYEYVYAPGQDIWRFHNRIITNSIGLRSGEPKKSDAVRILKIGDSVINGGPHVDQDNLSTTILEKSLTGEFKQPVRVFNVSAQSWGPDNAFAFMKAHGDFDAKIFVLVFSSHDLHDNMHFKKVVGEHRAWPASQPWCALTDGLNRYFIPIVKGWFGAKTEEYDYLLGFNDSIINPGWQQFIEYTRNKGVKLIMYHHATLTELKNKSYDKYGIQLEEMLQKDSVEVIQGITAISDRICYRDDIHLNEKGHAQLAAVLNSVLKAEVAKILQTKE